MTDTTYHETLIGKSPAQLIHAGEIVEMSTDERYVLIRYKGAWFTVDQGLEQGFFRVQPPMIRRGRDEHRFPAFVDDAGAQAVVRGAIGEVEGAFFDGSLQTVAFHRFVEKRGGPRLWDYLCFELAVRPVSDDRRAGDQALVGRMQGRPAFLRFEWRNGQTRLCNLGRSAITPEAVLREVYYAQVGLTRTFRDDPVGPPDAVPSMSVTLRVTEANRATITNLPAPFFHGVDADSAEFELIDATVPIEAVTRLDLEEAVCEVSPDCTLSGYDPATGTGRLSFVDCDAPAPGAVLALPLIK